MKSKKLYERLEKDFITQEMSDDWEENIKNIQRYVTEEYKKRSIGLVCDFTDEINKVYTSVFPSEKVMQKIIAENVTNALLFVHHPADWDITKAPNVFQEMKPELLEKFKEQKISIYNLHSPLDNYGEHSTSNSLAKALGLIVEKPFSPYLGGMSGVIAKTNLVDVQELKEKMLEVLGHEVSLYEYGTKEIKNGRIAIIAGGGNEAEYLDDALRENTNTFITGITLLNERSKPAHEFAKKNKMNILGGTHYSTEKFACISMTTYFKELGLESEFVNDEPVIEDM
ncbi:Nif3-like dinuclear metal center hexameric protein [Candidatus Woesearchaeota archaeon]|nr:Nif3-like dinuclear metal center hexameric protein [Candidatus Woesearchaeota archaeon]